MVVVNISPVTQFSRTAFSIEPVLLMISSISTPASPATPANVSAKVVVSEIPCCMNCFQPLLNPPIKNEFLKSDIALIVAPIVSFIPDHKSRASLKSPNITSNVCDQPEPTDSFNVSINLVRVVTCVAALVALLPISVVSSA